MKYHRVAKTADIGTAVRQSVRERAAEQITLSALSAGLTVV